ncbi:MAG: glutamate-1-semialdehyde 2,1-aminomutase [Pseudodesulfovibrio sp.]|jgi:glutamate-1-semialdehyde 2,1-aminomutase|uniref:Glutamate-1-semialdehyde 2,1-aminomutase n=1 Tax=Pseudodesulfovibrio indicus TaxID=1716143 RepID=A0A126QKF1_9BACT|nr:glutamate-1-semialdehyde 2,1-aminomutase [Pseudodesulfovibrio indicus]AMK10510.1 glutamate-1-semialdehyde aminotransferase [Pseudodesulfovibrio indicus]TDT89090.1 glutamate-1-semialdehyde 2,1-aminomutase [Pseudodesulfovibrio indicus]
MDSKSLYAKAQTLMPGGVNSPLRACKYVNSEPVFIMNAKGAYLWDVEGRRYIDYVFSWGPMILGHQDPAVTEAAHVAVDHGSSYGAPCLDEVALAEEINKLIPSMEMMRMVSSGTEATMSALRLARGYTGRDKFVKFIGNYHGHADAFLAAAGSAAGTVPGTPGVPEAVISHTLLAHYNDLDAVRAHFEASGDEIACVIVEPCAGNMGLVLPKDGFLQGLRDLCDQYGALLIFDEVITGFRLALGGAQARYGIKPDLTTLGKIIGGGFPVGCYGGKREIMEHMAPVGGVFQAGTLSGNPVAMAAGLAALKRLQECNYEGLEARTKALTSELVSIIESKGKPVYLAQVGSAFTMYFSDKPVTDMVSSGQCDYQAYAAYWKQMMAAGVYLAPAGFECAFTSFAHSDEDFERTLDAARNVKF